MKLWLDDVRPAPEGWVWVKTAQAAILHLSRYDVSTASLDHDLGICNACEDDLLRTDSGVCMTDMLSCPHNGRGMDVADWLADNPGRCPPHVLIHSFNPHGAVDMQKAITRCIPGVRCFVAPYNKKNYVTT